MTAGSTHFEPLDARRERCDQRPLFDDRSLLNGVGALQLLDLVQEERRQLVVLHRVGSTFEIWRDELRSAEDVAESSLATIRRRLRFEFARTRDGRFYVEPKVLVERMALVERRITNAFDYRGTLGPGQQQRFGPEDRGQAQPGRYWYAIGRDADLEHSLADRIADRAGGRVIPPQAPSQDSISPTASAASR